MVEVSGLMSCARPYERSAAFRAQGKTVVLGGPHVTLRPEEAAAPADAPAPHAPRAERRQAVARAAPVPFGAPTPVRLASFGVRDPGGAIWRTPRGGAASAKTYIRLEAWVSNR